MPIPEWVWSAGTMIGTMAVPMITMVVIYTKFVARMQSLEDARQQTHEQYEGFRSDLREHQEVDCTVMGELHKEASAIKETVVRTEESVKNIKATIDREYAETNRRITVHDDRNRQNVEKLTAALQSLSESVAVLKDKSPKRRGTS